MATTQLLVRNTMPRLRDPGACLGEVNRQLSTLVYNGQFVTMMILVIDHDNAGLEIASAGHHAPLLRRGGHVESLPIDPQLVVGVDSSVEYQTQRFRTQNGDTFLLFTDGAIEMTNAAGEQFRADRLSQAFAATAESARDVVAGISRALDQFRGEEEAEDDLTLLAVQVVQTDVGAAEQDGAALAAGI
jgi:sigma-B regulation protein RsbU (phosphoserine phosphatase)